MRKLKNLKKVIINGIFQELKKLYFQNEFGIIAEKQPILWEYFRTRKKIIDETGTMPDNKLLLKELNARNKRKWDKEMFFEMLAYEKKIKGYINIDEEYKYAGLVNNN